MCVCVCVYGYAYGYNILPYNHKKLALGIFTSRSMGAFTCLCISFQSFCNAHALHFPKKKKKKIDQIEKAYLVHTPPQATQVPLWVTPGTSN